MHDKELIYLDRMLGSLGYRYLGGITNRVYHHQDWDEILKLGFESDLIQTSGKLIAFQKCQEISRRYAAIGLMPEIYEVGENFQGCGYPFLREQYVPGKSMGAAYLDEPEFWNEKLPLELTRIYKTVQGFDDVNVTGTWQDKLEGMRCPKGYEDWFFQVQQIGFELMEHFPTGWRIHGDLQFGNILALQDQPGRIMLIDWEMSEVMPLGYEFAMLYAFLIDPDGQVMAQFKDTYRRQAPLWNTWNGICSCLVSQFGLAPTEIEKMIIFRMGNAWLYHFTKEKESRHGERAAELERQLEDLLSRRYFRLMPVTS